MKKNEEIVLIMIRCMAVHAVLQVGVGVLLMMTRPYDCLVEW